MSLSFVLIDQESDTLFSSRGHLDKENFISIADRYSFNLPHHSSHSSAHNAFPLLSQCLLFLFLRSSFPHIRPCFLTETCELLQEASRRDISHRSLQEVQEQEKTPKKKNLSWALLFQ